MTKHERSRTVNIFRHWEIRLTHWSYTRLPGSLKYKLSYLASRCQYCGITYCARLCSFCGALHCECNNSCDCRS